MPLSAEQCENDSVEVKSDEERVVPCGLALPHDKVCNVYLSDICISTVKKNLRHSSSLHEWHILCVQTFLQKKK